MNEDAKMVLGVIVVVAFLAVNPWLQQRRVDRENARRKAQYIKDCERARARGVAPPPPPNHVRLG